MVVIPDNKDWTWVLGRPCPQCQLTAVAIPATAVPGLLRRHAAAWAQVLTGDVRTRPAPGVWSPLEYACHVRDVQLLYDERLVLMLGVDDPQYPSWDQNEAAVSQRYGEQDPARVSAELVAATEAMAGRLEHVTDFSRPGRRGDGAGFTVESLARYVVHEVVHHLHDVRREPPPG